MILKQEKPIPEFYSRKYKERYAVFPTRMKRNELDSNGAIIWLEKYITTYEYSNHSTMHTSLNHRVRPRWTIASKQTLSNFALSKLQEDNMVKKESESAGISAGVCMTAGNNQIIKQYMPPQP